MSRSVVESEIPRHHQHKSEIEAALLETASRIGGEWTIEVLPAHMGPWWILRLRASSGEMRTLLLDPVDQNPASVRAAVQEAIGEVG